MEEEEELEVADSFVAAFLSASLKSQLKIRFCLASHTHHAGREGRFFALSTILNPRWLPLKLNKIIYI